MASDIGDRWASQNETGVRCGGLLRIGDLVKYGVPVESYAEACRALGESIVRERLLMKAIQNLAEANKAGAAPPLLGRGELLVEGALGTILSV